jgi:putative transposase
MLAPVCGPQILHPAVDLSPPGFDHVTERTAEPGGNDTRAMSNRRPSFARTIRRLLRDGITLVRLGLTSRAHLAAENLFLRKQLALYQERRTKPRRPDQASRVALVLLSQWLDWRSMLTVVQPDTMIRWHRQGWRLFWRWKSRPGRPPIPADVQRLIIAMARANPTWGEERIADELLLKLGLTVSPRTVGRYLRRLRPSRGGRPAQRWATFVRNHAQAVLACDFFIAVTARFRVLYVFVVLDVGTRRIVHWNVTEHPTADWTIQQCRAVITGETAHRFLIHDRDAIYAPAVDGAIRSMGLRVLKTPVRTPQANAFCERVIGTIRRECLDWLIPLHERHLRGILREWVSHYNRGRPHASLGPGIPEPSPALIRPAPTGHRLPTGSRVIATPVLNGLHHEYQLGREAA